MDRARRYKEPLSLVLLNLNDFKKYNKTWGVTQGDRALLATAEVLEDCLRTTDIISRSGGGQFAIILPHTDLIHAKLVCQRISAALEATPIDSPDGGTPPLSASFGTALYETGKSASQLIEEASRVLYFAKMQREEQSSIK